MGLFKKVDCCKTVKPGDRVVRVIHDNVPLCKVGDIGTIVEEDDTSRGVYGPMSKYATQGYEMVLCRFDNGKTGPCWIHKFMLLEDLEAVHAGIDAIFDTE